MTEVRLAAAAVEDLRELILTHELPPNTPQRIARRLRALRRFPKLGYDYDEVADTVVVLTMRDARRADSPTSA